MIAQAMERERPFADEIIVVDALSSDRTATIAVRGGAAAAMSYIPALLKRFG